MCCLGDSLQGNDVSVQLLRNEECNESGILVEDQFRTILMLEFKFIRYYLNLWWVNYYSFTG